MEKIAENYVKTRHNGFFITFEGPEGAGKSTQVRMLLDRLNGRRQDSAFATREPGGTPLAERLRELFKYGCDGEKIDPRTEILLLEAGRVQHVERVIRPGLDAGKIVICDRFTDSTVAYQGAGRGLSAEEIDPLNDFACAGIVPDITFLLDLPVEEGLERAKKRDPEASASDRLEQEKITFHQRLRQGFLDLAARYPERFVVLDAKLPPDVLHGKIWSVCNDHGI